MLQEPKEHVFVLFHKGKVRYFRVTVQRPEWEEVLEKPHHPLVLDIIKSCLCKRVALEERSCEMGLFEGILEIGDGASRVDLTFAFPSLSLH